MSRLQVLVAEEIADSGLAFLRESYDVVDASGEPRDAILARLPSAHALIVRSATKVDAEAVSAGRELRVIGRAGVGVDNVDLDAATRAGVIVVNAPTANVLSNAEHTMALLLAQARNIPAADRALRGGTWARSRFQGIELHGKTIGLLGLGRVGSLVAQRASAFGMHLVAHDPYVSRDRARQMGISLRESVDDVLAESDFVVVALVKTEETSGMLSRDRLLRMKPGARIVNSARGGIIDEAALAELIASGHIAGAALDVFDAEPTTESPLFSLDEVVVTPHLGASTAEAQDKAGAAIAEQIDLALRGEFVPFAVNVAAGEVPEAVRPFLPLCEMIGRVFTGLAGAVPAKVEVSIHGAIADHDTRILSLSVLRGLFTDIVDEPVTLVNAPLLARDRGVDFVSSSTTIATDYVNLVRIESTTGGRLQSVAATLVGPKEQPRIVEIDGATLEGPPAARMLIVHNDDRPGVIGSVGTILGTAGVNIEDMHVGRHPDRAHALMFITVGSAVPAGALAELRSAGGILDVRAVSLSS